MDTTEKGIVALFTFISLLVVTMMSFDRIGTAIQRAPWQP